MAQSECLDILEKYKKWMTSKQIAKLLKQKSSIVSSSLRKLYLAKFIKRRLLKNSVPKITYEWRSI